MKKYNVILIVLSFVVFVFLTYILFLIKELPSGEELKNFTPALSTKILDRNGLLITEFFTQKRTWVELNNIPQHTKFAVLAIEDHTFYDHWGVNPKRILKALLDNITKRRIVVGGSTITQQLAKIAFLTHKRSIKRKIKELLLALNLEHNFSKDEILEMYLNQVYFGHGAYGVQQAAMIYFSKNVTELTLSESAMLAGLIRSPAYYSPLKNYDRAIKRRNIVLKRMLQLKYITEKEYEEAIAEPLICGFYKIPSATAPYFIEYIREELESEFTPEYLYTAGLTIHTTLDLNLQRSAENLISQHLSLLDKVLKSSEPVQAALVCLDVKTGQILTMVGGRDFRKTQFNRVTQARRQPGSAFKPIVFLAAIENGYTPATIIEDTPLIFFNNGIDWELVGKTTRYSELDYTKLKNIGVVSEQDLVVKLPQLIEKNKIWLPENYKNRYFGKVTLRRALELSLNSCAIRLTMDVGPACVIEYARKLGITTPLTNTYSLALGASEVIPLELVCAFNTFANNGVRVEPYGILEVRDKFGNVLKSYLQKETVVISPESAFIITNLLKGVIRNGTGSYARNLGKICAGKTGTTNDCTDAWFIGYTPDIICGVWIGFDVKKSLGKDSTGGKIACPIWTEFMKVATAKLENKDFQKPENIVDILIDATTGLLPTSSSKKTYIESFIKGTEPTQYSNVDGVLYEPTVDLEDTGF
ncbi:MAG: penicillin-binding protein 1A [Endomicrobia bacterium]|nr:penicillin-binding protein 1A [Endomicrobiia bacterium]MDW8055421.1 penicillin-binding protein 1A [Elusimicrobiota bacterium]